MKRNNKPVRYRVRRVKSKPHSPWVCDFFAHGKRIRKFFASEELAWGEGARLTKVVEAKGTEGLTEPDGGITVASALRVWAADVDPRSDSHQQKVGIFLKAFPKAFRGAVGDIQPAAMRRWIRARSDNGNTQAMYYRYAANFFGYLKANRLIPDNPMDGVPAPKTSPARNILKPSQMKALLALELPDVVRAFLLLGGFAGIRTEELKRMSWHHVDIKRRQIHVPPEASKETGGFDERIVDFTEPLTRRKAWLAKQGAGPIIPMALETFHFHKRRAFQSVLKTWPDNCLRHSYATYHLARAKNAGLTAFQMGHTDVKMVQRVYAVPAARADWRAWWAL
jgi:integrase